VREFKGSGVCAARGPLAQKIYEAARIRPVMGDRRRRARSRLFLLVIAFLLISPPVRAPAPDPSGTLRVDSDTELLGFGSLQGGGKMTWVLTGGQALRFREKVVGFYDETGIMPDGFPNMLTPPGFAVHVPGDTQRGNGILEEPEGDRYARDLGSFLIGQGSGFDYRYVRITRVNKLQQDLPVIQSSKGFIGTTLSNQEPLELRFWYNGFTVGSDVQVPLSELEFANAIHAVFDYELSQDFEGLRPVDARYPFTKPFNMTTAGVMWVNTSGGFVANWARGSWPPRYNASATQSTSQYLDTSDLAPLDLRFGSEAEMRLDWSADVGAGDGLRVEVCVYDAATAGCAGAWEALRDQRGSDFLQDTGGGIGAVQTSVYDLDAYLGDRVRLRLNFTADTVLGDDGEGIRIHAFDLRAPSYAQGVIHNNHADFLVGTANLNAWNLVAGGGNYIRTPAGVIGLYSNTFDASAVPGDTVRFQSFDFFENQQILFGLVIVAAWLQSYFMDKFYLDSKAKVALRSRAAFTRPWWLIWTGRIVILLMILWYFFPGMFAALGAKLIIPGSFLWGWSIGGSLGMVLFTRFFFVKKAAAMPVALAREVPAAAGPAQVCNNCFNPMTDPNDQYRCECGENYHAHCAANLSACPSCKRPIQPVPTAMVAKGPMVEATCPSCGVPNQVLASADLAAERCVACQSPLKPLQRGLNYLVVAAGPEPAYRWFNGLLLQNVPGLILSKTFPEKLKREYTLGNAEMFWISDTSPGPKILDPRRLDFEIMRAFSNFVKANRGGVVMLDGVEYLVVENGFDKVFKFLKKVNDLCGPNEITLFVPMAPNSLEQEAMTMVVKEFDRIEYVGQAPPPPPPSTPPPPDAPPPTDRL